MENFRRRCRGLRIVIVEDPNSCHYFVGQSPCHRSPICCELLTRKLDFTITFQDSGGVFNNTQDCRWSIFLFGCSPHFSWFAHFHPRVTQLLAHRPLAGARRSSLFWYVKSIREHNLLLLLARHSNHKTVVLILIPLEGPDVALLIELFAKKIVRVSKQVVLVAQGSVL